VLLPKSKHMTGVDGATGENPDGNGDGDSGIGTAETSPQTSYTLSPANSAIGNSLQRGESHELSIQCQIQTQQPELGMRQRSRSNTARDLAERA
jgi:hypothetical protein